MGPGYRQREAGEKHKDQKKENRREDERKQVTETGKELGGRKKRERRGEKREKGQGAEKQRGCENQGGQQAPAAPPRPRPLTGPAWGCPRFHTSHTRGSADTRDSSGIGHSSDTEAPSAHCGEAGVRPPRPISTLPFRAPAARPRTCRPSLGSPRAGTGPGRRRTGSRCGWTGTRRTGSS